MRQWRAMSGWWQEARTGAAREFGRRHYRLFAAAAITRRLLPTFGVLVVAGAAAVGIWVLVHSHGHVVVSTATSWVRPALAAAAAALVAAALIAVWRRWG